MELPFVLQNLGKQFNMKILIKTKVMSFKGKYLVCLKITVLNSITEQLSYFNHLGCDISYEADYNVNTKIHQYQ
jgi:hypothetical protein